MEIQTWLHIAVIIVVILNGIALIVVRRSNRRTNSLLHKELASKDLPGHETQITDADRLFYILFQRDLPKVLLTTRLKTRNAPHVVNVHAETTLSEKTHAHLQTFKKIEKGSSVLYYRYINDKTAAQLAALAYSSAHTWEVRGSYFTVLATQNDTPSDQPLDLFDTAKVHETIAQLEQTLS